MGLPTTGAPVGRGSWWTGIKEVTRWEEEERNSVALGQSGEKKRRGGRRDGEGTRDDDCEMRTGRKRDLYVPAGPGSPSYFFTPLEELSNRPWQVPRTMAGRREKATRYEHRPDGPPEKFRELPCLGAGAKVQKVGGPGGVGRGRRRRSVSAAAQRFKRSTRIRPGPATGSKSHTDKCTR